MLTCSKYTGIGTVCLDVLFRGLVQKHFFFVESYLCSTISKNYFVDFWDFVVWETQMKGCYNAKSMYIGACIQRKGLNQPLSQQL